MLSKPFIFESGIIFCQPVKMMGFKICSFTHKFKVRVRVRLVKEPYGGSGGLAPWVMVRVRYAKIPYGGSGGLAPWVRVR